MRKLFTLFLLGFCGMVLYGQTVYNAPYLQTFDTFPVDNATFGPGAEPFPFPMNWINVQTGDDAQDWYGRSIATGSSNTGPSVDHTSGSGVYVFVEDGWGSYTNVQLQSPWISLSGPAELSYWAHSWTTASSGNSMRLEITTDSISWTQVDSFGILSSTDVWLQRLVNLAAYAGDTVKFRFIGANNVTSFEHDIAIDDFEVYTTQLTTDISQTGAPLCTGDTTGSLTATQTFGTPPFTYAWSTGATGMSISGLAAGTYCVTMTDSLGTIDSACYVITEPGPLSFQLNPMTPICDGAMDGMITVDSAMGGTPYPVGCMTDSSYTCAISDTNQVGFGTNQLSDTQYPAVWGNWYWGAKNQMLFRASELLAAGIQPGYITGVAWDATITTGTTSYTGMEVAMACVPDSSLTAWIPQVTTVFPATNLTIAAGWNYISFPEGYFWNGTDNLVIQTCFNNSSFTRNSPHNYTTTPFPSCVYYRADNSNVCSSTATTGTSSDRPNIRIIGCAGNGPEAYAYQWSNGDSVGHLDSVGAGNYTLTMMDANGCMVSDSAEIESTPAVDIDDVVLCDGAAQTLDAGMYNSYMWSTGDSTQTTTVSAAGQVYVDVVDSIGCMYSDSADVTIASSPAVSLGSDTTACANDGALTLDAGAGSTYMWSDSSMNQTLDVTASGTYSVMVTDSNGCMGGDTITVTVSPGPSVALGADTTICDDEVPYTIDAGAGGSSYTWSTGATSQTIDVTTSGTYSVMVTDGDGCMNGDTIVITVDVCTSIGDPGSVLGARVFPNPAQTFVNVALDNATPGDIKIMMFDVNGRQVHNQESETAGTSALLKLDLSQLSEGIYFLHLHNGGKQSVHRITIQ